MTHGKRVVFFVALIAPEEWYLEDDPFLFGDGKFQWLCQSCRECASVHEKWSSWPPWDHSPFGRIHGHNSFNSFNAFMNEKRKLQRTFFHQLLCPSFSKANLSSFPSPLWKYLYIISMSNLWGSPNQDVQWQKFPNKKTFQVWCAPPCLVFSSWRGGISFWLVGGDAVDGRNPKSS